MRYMQWQKADAVCCCRSGIANLDYFTNAPVLLMYGFMCVALTAAIWDNLATLLYLPVSTTHTTGAPVCIAPFARRLNQQPIEHSLQLSQPHTQV